MSDAPATTENTADLGDAFAKVGYTYIKTGAARFLKDSEAIIAAHARVEQSGVALAASYAQHTQAERQQTQATSQSTRARRQQAQTTDESTRTEKQHTQATEQSTKAQTSRARAAAQTAKAVRDGERLAQQAVQNVNREYTRLEKLSEQARRARIQQALTTKDYAKALQLLDQEQQREGKTTAQLIQLETQSWKVREQAARAARSSQGGSEQPVLPRSFAGFTGEGLLQGLGAVGIITSADQLLGKLSEIGQESIDLARRASTIGVAYEAAAKKAGVSSDGLLQRLKASSRGTVTEADLQINANKALSLGVGQNMQQVADLMAIARQRGKDFGVDTGEAFQRIVEGLGKAEPEILDELGILIDSNKVYKEYAASIGVSADELTKKQKIIAVTNEVLRTNTDLIEKNANAQLDDADRAAEAQAKIQESKTRIGKSLSPVASGFLAETADLLEVFTGGTIGKRAERDDDLVANAANFADYNRQVEEANAKQLTWFSTVDRLSESQFNLAKSLLAAGHSGEEVRETFSRLNDVQLQLDNVIGPAGDRLRTLQSRLLAVAAASPELTSTVQEHIAVFESGAISYEQLVIVLDALEKGLTDSAKAEATASAEAARLAEANRVAAERSKQLAESQDELKDALVQASSQIQQATERRNEQLDELETRHTERVEELQSQQTKAALKTQDDIQKAVRDGAAERTKIEEGYAKQVREAAEQYGDQREKIISQGQQRLADLEQRQRDEQVRAEREFSTTQLNERASFLTRLNAMTNQRGGGGAKARAEARSARAQAEAEAAELAKIDPQAAAALLQERQQQILDNLQRKQENAQRLKDAKRGGSLSSAEAQRQIDEENAAETAAQQSRIDAIKNGAVDRQKQREQERANVQAEVEQQLQDLDENYADQLRKLREANAERLQEFDERQKERLDQLAEHGREQQAALQSQLDEEELQYRKQQDAIRKDYAKFLLELRDELKKQANELDLTPEEKRQKELALAYHTLGQALGEAFTEGLQGAAQTGQFIIPPDLEREPQPQRRPPASSTTPTPPGKGPGSTSPQATTRSRGSVVGQTGKDSVLSDQAIDQVVAGGRQTDGFSSLRGNQLHAGVDLAVPVGTPVKTPVAGEVIGVGASTAGGNYVKVRGSNGDVWYFGHLSRASVRAGDQVRRGQQVALSGESGTAIKGAHLHLQLQPGGGRASDPTAILESLARAAPTAGAASGGSSPQSTTGGASVSNTASNGVLPGEQTSTRFEQYAAAPPAPVNAGNVDQSVNVDLRNAQFGAGVSMQQVEQAVKQGVQQGMDATARQLNQAVQQLDTQGAMAI